MAFEEPTWHQGCLKPLSAATRQLFNILEPSLKVLDQMETIKLFAAKKKKKKETESLVTKYVWILHLGI